MQIDQLCKTEMVLYKGQLVPLKHVPRSQFGANNAIIFFVVDGANGCHSTSIDPVTRHFSPLRRITASAVPAYNCYSPNVTKKK